MYDNLSRSITSRVELEESYEPRVFDARWLPQHITIAPIRDEAKLPSAKLSPSLPSLSREIPEDIDSYIDEKMDEMERAEQRDARIRAWAYQVYLSRPDDRFVPVT
jgi:hypothetical protein